MTATTPQIRKDIEGGEYFVTDILVFQHGFQEIPTMKDLYIVVSVASLHETC
jgi:hypothetical protein